MSFSKFVLLLSQGALYFCRPEAFRDRFENAIGPASLRGEWEEGYRRWFREVIENGIEPGESLDDAELEEEVEGLLEQFRDNNRSLHKNMYLNCWHESTHESEAMWRLYSTDTVEGVAIRSTCGRLVRSLPESLQEGAHEFGHLTVKRVNYVDYDLGPMPLLDRCFFKRKAFEHEKEVRARYILFDETPPEEPGRLVPTRLETLLEEVVVSPYAPKWLEPCVKDVCSAFGSKVPVRHSSFADEAGFAH